MNRTLIFPCLFGGCVSLLVSLAVAALPTAPAFPREAELEKAFRERSALVIDSFVEQTDATDPGFGNLVWVAANFARGTNLEWARARLASLASEPTGNMFWMYPFVTLMKAGAEHLSVEDWAIIQRVWREYFPYRGDTENHWLMYYASLYLAAETWPEAGPGEWYTGKSSAENLAEARDYFFHWVRVTTSYGQGEYDSPHYLDTFVIPLSMLAGWANDPTVRETARMMLDYVIADFATENLNGLYGGAYSRIYESGANEPARAPSATLAWLLFGQGEYRLHAASAVLSLSGYRPPAILHRIAHDRSESFLHLERKRTRWRMRHAGPEAFEVEGRRTIPVYRTTWMDPAFVLGSSQGGLLQPIQQMTWTLIWHEEDTRGTANIFFALHPHYSAKEGTMYFAEIPDTVVDLIARSKVTYDDEDKLTGGSPHEQVFQHRRSLIALYRIPDTEPFPHVTAFFSRDLQDRTECASGWIFARGGPSFIAFRPLVPGEWKPAWWTGRLAAGAGGWISRDFEQWGTGHEVHVSANPANGYVLQVVPAREFASFDAFQDAIRALSLRYDLDPVRGPSLQFTSLDGERLHAVYGQVPRVNGRAVDFSRWPLFRGPFLEAAVGSRELTIRHGGERLHLDFQRLRRTVTFEAQP